MPGSYGRTLGIVAGLALGVFCSRGLAQTPPSVAVSAMPASKTVAGPGFVAWPGQTPAPAPTTPPSAPLLEAPPTAFPPTVLEEARPVDLQPLPGSLVDNYEQELTARRGFRFCTWKGTTLTGLPNSLLWNPPFGIQREPRFLLMPSWVKDYNSKYVFDSSIGGTVGVLRADMAGHDVSLQLDVGAVVHSRNTTDNLIATDTRYTIPLTARWGPWHGKLAYEYSESRYGERYYRQNPAFAAANLVPGFVAPDWSKKEFVLGVGRYLVEDYLRLYGQVAYAYSQELPLLVKDEPYRFDVGFEWFRPGPTGLNGAPFLAANLEARGDQDYEPNVTVQAGWLWRNPFQRLANVRLFAQYYYGGAPYGQLSGNREKYASAGLSCDY